LKTIIAIDPASYSSGFAVAVDGVIGDTGAIIVPKGIPLEQRLVRITAAYERLGELYRPTHLVVEQMYTFANWQVSWSSAAIVAALAKSGEHVTMSQFPIMTWKSFLKGLHIDREEYMKRHECCNEDAATARIILEAYLSKEAK
jgi:Holliday junction resolvasome RuvABC endonuclease subunit